MSVKPQARSRIDFESPKVKEYIREGAPVLEDVLEEERKKEEKIKLEDQERLRLQEENKRKEEEKWTMISMRIPMKLLKEINEKADKRYMNRSAWILEAIQENLKRYIG